MLRRAVIAAMLTGCATHSSLAQGTGGRAGAPFSFAPLVKKVVPAVVNISVVEGSEPAPGPSDPRRPRARRPVLGAGSGFVIDPSGVIVTNTHVVSRSSRISVTLANGTELAGQLIGSDELTDLAVIRVTPAAPLPYVQWG